MRLPANACACLILPASIRMHMFACALLPACSYFCLRLTSCLLGCTCPNAPVSASWMCLRLPVCAWLTGLALTWLRLAMTAGRLSCLFVPSWRDACTSQPSCSCESAWACLRLWIYLRHFIFSFFWHPGHFCLPALKSSPCWSACLRLNASPCTCRFASALSSTCLLGPKFRTSCAYSCLRLLLLLQACLVRLRLTHCIRLPESILTSHSACNCQHARDYA
jgi:hypothetical protein